jgi:hypothetical protein
MRIRRLIVRECSGLGISVRIQGNGGSGEKGKGENWTPRVQFHRSGPGTHLGAMTGGLKNRSRKWYMRSVGLCRPMGFFPSQQEAGEKDSPLLLLVLDLVPSLVIVPANKTRLVGSTDSG